MKTYKVTGIKYDTDGEDIDLPESMDITIPETVDETNEDEVLNFISDEISNRTGFCHFGFNLV
jgi:hypothetical protein